MLINGLSIEGKENVVIGTDATVCNNCAALKASEERIEYPEAFLKLKGKYVGQQMKQLPYLKDKFGNRVYLCKKCADKFSEELR